MSDIKPTTQKFFKWTVEIEVAESWVADGFDLTDERAHAMVCSDLTLAEDHEIRASVVKRPDEKSILVAQGYEKAGQP